MAYLVELTSTAVLNRDTPFDPFGGPHQTIQHKTADFVQFSCDATAPTLATPANLGRVVLGYSEFMLADYLRLAIDPPKICLSASWLNPTVVCFQGNCHQDVNLSATLDVRVGGDLVGRQIYVNDTRQSVSLGANALQYAYANWATLKGRFENADLSGAPPLFLSADPLNRAMTLLEAALAGYQHVLYARMANALSPGGALAGAGKELAGGKKLLAAYMTVGMPNALERDDVLHSLLFGSQGLIDDTAVLATFALSATQPISGAQLAINQRLVLEQVGVARSDAFEALVSDYVRAIGTPAGLLSAQSASSSAAMRHSEDFATIADARRDLQLVLLFSMSGGASGAGRRLFIPVVSR